MKIRYIETKPIQKILEFEDRAKWNEFFDKRIREIIDYTSVNDIDYKEYFVYNRIILNKNGTPRKMIDPTWLNTKKTRKNQRKNWLVYLEKKKKQTIERNYIKQLAEISFNIEYWQNQKKELDEKHKLENNNETL